MYNDRASPEQQGSYTLLVGYGRAKHPYAVRTRLLGSLTLETGRRAPPHRSFAAPLGEFNNTKGKLREKSHFRRKIRESVTAFLLVQLCHSTLLPRHGSVGGTTCCMKEDQSHPSQSF